MKSHALRFSQARKKYLASILPEIMDLMFNDGLIVFDEKHKSIEDVVDVCINGPSIQLTIRPVVERKRGKK